MPLIPKLMRSSWLSYLLPRVSLRAVARDLMKRGRARALKEQGPKPSNATRSPQPRKPYERLSPEELERVLRALPPQSDQPKGTSLDPFLTKKGL
jgi:hypothetical protein